MGQGNRHMVAERRCLREPNDIVRNASGAHNFITAIEASVAHDFHAARVPWPSRAVGFEPASQERRSRILTKR